MHGVFLFLTRLEFPMEYFPCHFGDFEECLYLSIAGERYMGGGGYLMPHVGIACVASRWIVGFHVCRVVFVSIALVNLPIPFFSRMDILSSPFRWKSKVIRNDSRLNT